MAIESIGAAGRTDGQLVYAIGDVHGCYGLMKALLAQLAPDSAERAKGRRPVLIFCGDYVDRGPASPQVLEALVWLKRRGDFDLHLLKGNHEQGMLAFIDNPGEGVDWLRFGGGETLYSYGVAVPTPDEGEAGLVRARDELLANMPASHLRLLQGLELMVMVGDYAFVHAGVRPGAKLTGQSEDDLLWIRRPFLEAPGPFEKVVVHGHTWIDERPQIHEHRVGLDTGAYATGVLTAARFEDGEMALFQAGRAWTSSSP
jgi:serine/threonine protein phosphatase 1